MKIIRNWLLLAALALALPAAPAAASQGSCVMPTTGTVSGLTLVNDINTCNQAILSLESGATAPSSPVAGMLWFNTSTNNVQIYDGAAWLNLWYVDATNHLISIPVSAGGITTLAAAGTMDLGAASHTSSINISAGVSISSFGNTAPIGSIYFLNFTANGQIIHSSSIVCPGAQNIVTNNGDSAVVLKTASGVWKVITYNRGDLAPQFPAYTLWGNNSNGTADPTPVRISGFAAKASPTGSDLVWIEDVSNTSWKKITLSQIAALVGVVSINGQQGALTLGTCLTNSGTTILFNCFVFNAAATKADQQAATSNVVGVTPLHQQDHPSALKVNCAFQGRTTASLLGGYGCSGISKAAAGVYQINFTTAFANTNYRCVGSVVENATLYFATKLTTSIVVNTVNLGASPVGSDTAFDIMCAGDQ